MAAQLSAHNAAVALLANTFATEAILAVLFNLLGPISGAHFDPAVSVVQALRGETKWRNASAYSITQIVGCCVGTLLPHGMFGLLLLQTSTHVRAGFAQWLSEAVATGGLGASRDWEQTSQRCALDRGRLDRRNLLVHRFDFVCEPGDFRCPLAQRYVRRHSPDRRAAFCARAICRCASRIGAKPGCCSAARRDRLKIFSQFPALVKR